MIANYTYTKKNIAESDCGVACHRKMNSVGRYTFGCLTAVHKLNMHRFEVSRKPKPLGRRLDPFTGTQTGCSSTSTATADVIKGSKAVTPNTNLRDPN